MCDETEAPSPAPEDEMECVCVPKAKPKPRLDSLPCTCPYDPRFPNTNQTRRCYVNFVDYHRCVRLLGSYQGCRIFKKCYLALCPNEWIKKWEEDMATGLFECFYPPEGESTDFPDESEPFDTAGY